MKGPIGGKGGVGTPTGGARLVAAVLIIILALASAVLLIGLASRVGVFEVEETFSGPFEYQANGSFAVALELAYDIPYRRLWLVRSDTNERPRQSSLKIWVNSAPLSGAHSVHVEVASAKTLGKYSHWGRHVIFSLPPPLNGAGTQVRVRYRRELRPGLAAIALGLLFASAALLIGKRISSIPRDRRRQEVAKRVEAWHIRVSRLAESRATDYSLWALLVLALGVVVAGAALLGGVYKVHQTFEGPFSYEAPGTGVVALELGRESALGWLGLLRPDTIEHPRQSTLEVTVNGTRLPGPHTVHSALSAASAFGSYSHWGRHLLLALPERENRAETVIQATCPVELDPTAVTIASLLCLGAGALLWWRRIRREPVVAVTDLETVVRSYSVIIRSAGGLLVALSAGYAASIAYGWWRGYRLPITAIIYEAPSIAQGLLHRSGFSLSTWLLIAAFLGAVLSRCVSRHPEVAEAARIQERRLLRLYTRFGLIVLSAVFLFMLAAGWTHLDDSPQLDWEGINGLVPHSDAQGYLWGSFVSAAKGYWPEISTRRPFAAALRDLGMRTVDYSLPAFLGLQALALAFAAYLSSLSVMKWRGVWAGLAYLGLCVTHIRPFLTANLTEPLGLILVLVAVPFLVAAIEGAGQKHSLLALLLYTSAILTRMGDMFSILGLGLWIVRSDQPRAISLTRKAMGVMATLALTGLLSHGLRVLYGSKSGVVGGNFSFVACGLTHGGNWLHCPELYKAEIARSVNGEAQLNAFMYEKAWAKFRDEPLVLARRLWEAESYFVSNVWDTLLGGYLGEPPSPQVSWGLACLAAIGLVELFRRRVETREAWFWIVMTSTLALSAPIVIFDDGWRVLCVSYPVLMLLLASSLTTPSCYMEAPAPLRSEHRLGRAADTAWAVVVLVAIGMLIVPWMAYKGDATGIRRLAERPRGDSRSRVLGGKCLSGFLVVADDSPLPRVIPAVRLTPFVTYVRTKYGPMFASARIPPTPFAVVSAIQIAQDEDLRVLPLSLTGPSELLTRRDVALWALDLSGEVDTLRDASCATAVR